MPIWKSVGQQLGGLVKHVGQALVNEPGEVIKDMVGLQMEQAAPTASQSGGQGKQTDDPMQDLAQAGFKTPGDFQQYVGKSGQKDQMELEMIRKQLVRQWGLDANLESGMQRARAEWEQKEEQRKQVEEKKEEQKKEFEFQKKQQEDIALKAAKQGSSAENKAWGAG